MTKPDRFIPVVLIACAVALAIVLIDAARLRGTRASMAEESTRLLGLADLALSSNARWLRHPSQAEPGAAMADGPFAFDVEPAGGVLLPPRALHRETSRDVRRVDP